MTKHRAGIFNTLTVLCFMFFAQHSHALAENCIIKTAELLTQVKNWNLDTAVEKQLKLIWSNPHLSEQEKLLGYYEIFVNARLKDSNFVSRFFAKSPAKKSLRQTGIYPLIANPIAKALLFGPHYNPFFNRIALPDFNQRTISDLIVAFHEFDHALERNKNPLPFALLLAAVPKELWMAIPTPLMPLSYLRIESTALGSQWEFMQRIPTQIRVRWLQLLSTTVDTAELLNQFNQLVEVGTVRRLYDKLLPDLKNKYGLNRAEIILREQIVTSLFDARNEKWLPVETPTSATPSDRNFERFLTRTRTAIEKINSPGIMGDAIKDIAFKTLLHSFYTKQEFIKIQGEVQNYTATKLLKRHYTGAWRRVIWGQLALVSIFAASSQVPEEEWNEMWARDIKFYLNSISQWLDNK